MSSVCGTGLWACILHIWRVSLQCVVHSAFHISMHAKCHVIERYSGTPGVRGAERVEDRDMIWTGNVRRKEPQGALSGAARFFASVTEWVLETF